jgi:hypothetical protein
MHVKPYGYLSKPHTHTHNQLLPLNSACDAPLPAPAAAPAAAPLLLLLPTAERLSPSRPSDVARLGLMGVLWGLGWGVALLVR